MASSDAQLREAISRESQIFWRSQLYGIGVAGDEKTL
jgi:hypothetical protein